MYPFKNKRGKKGPVVIKQSTWWHTYSMDKNHRAPPHPSTPHTLMATVFNVSSKKELPVFEGLTF